MGVIAYMCTLISLELLGEKTAESQDDFREQQAVNKKQ